MILPTVFLVLATSCTPNGIGEERPESMVCEAGFIPDSSACVPESCGTGKWGNLPVDDDTVYVDSSAEEGGDGTEAAPYATIQRGLNRAGALGGALVALAAGSYPETLEFTTEHADVHLAGRCREMTILDASVGDGETPGIEIDAEYAAVEVSGVTVNESSEAGLVVASGEVAVRDSAISGSVSFGVVAYLPGFSGMTGLAMEGCLIDGNADDGLLASNPGTEVTLRDTTVKDTQPNANGEGGRGIEVQDGAILSAEGCLIDRNTEEGLVAFDPGTEVALRDTTVKDTQPNANGEFGRGIQVSDGATLSAEGCLVDGNTDIGLLVGNPGTEVTLRDTTVNDTQPDANGEYGRGIEVTDGATLSAEACLIDGNTELGLFASDPGTEVTLRDTTVKDTQPDANGEYGRGIAVQDGATLSTEGCLIDGNTDLGLFASSGTEVTLRDSTISGTKPGTEPTASAASGVAVQWGAFLFASHLVVAANQGPGLLVNSDGVLECTGCTVEDNQFAGAVALMGGTLSISDSTIEGTTSGTNLLGGAGVYAWPWNGGPPTVILTNTLIQDNPIAGVWLIGNGTYILDSNTISGDVGEPFGSGTRCGDAILARDGVMAWDGKTGLLLRDNEFLDASGAGVFLDRSSALLSGNTWSGNAVDLVVQNQSCDSIPSSYTEAPQRDLCPIYNYPTCYAEFFLVAMPADPVDWEEDKAAPRPARSDHPSILPSLSR